MNTYDNLYYLLTININKRRCFNDEKKTNEECPKHCMLVMVCRNIFAAVVVVVILATRKEIEKYYY
jgi:hypothetical protein